MSFSNLPSPIILFHTNVDMSTSFVTHTELRSLVDNKKGGLCVWLKRFIELQTRQVTF